MYSVRDSFKARFYPNRIKPEKRFARHENRECMVVSTVFEDPAETSDWYAFKNVLLDEGTRHFLKGKPCRWKFDPKTRAIEGFWIVQEREHDLEDRQIEDRVSEAKINMTPELERAARESGQLARLLEQKATLDDLVERDAV